jgi:hypothetical protein
MHHPTVRVWTLMAALVVVGLILCGIVQTSRRRQRFQRIADYHQRKIPNGAFQQYPISGHDEWHNAMAMKYHFAADHPLLPVAPDYPAPMEVPGPVCTCRSEEHTTTATEIEEALSREGWWVHSMRRADKDNDPARIMWDLWAQKGKRQLRIGGKSEDEAFQQLLKVVRAREAN